MQAPSSAAFKYKQNLKFDEFRVKIIKQSFHPFKFTYVSLLHLTLVWYNQFGPVKNILLYYYYTHWKGKISQQKQFSITFRKRHTLKAGTVANKQQFEFKPNENVLYSMRVKFVFINHDCFKPCLYSSQKRVWPSGRHLELWIWRSRVQALPVILFPQTRSPTPLCLSSPQCIQGYQRHTAEG